MTYKRYGEEWKKEMLKNNKRFIVDMFSNFAQAKTKQEKALYDLFQACSDLPLDEMNRMESVINAASEALKNA